MLSDLGGKKITWGKLFDTPSNWRRRLRSADLPWPSFSFGEGSSVSIKMFWVMLLQICVIPWPLGLNLESSDTEELGLALTQHFTATGPVLAFIIPSLRNQSRKDYYIFWSEAEKMALGEAWCFESSLFHLWDMGYTWEVSCFQAESACTHTDTHTHAHTWGSRCIYPLSSVNKS